MDTLGSQAFGDGRGTLALAGAIIELHRSHAVLLAQGADAAAKISSPYVGGGARASAGAAAPAGLFQKHLGSLAGGSAGAVTLAGCRVPEEGVDALLDLGALAAAVDGVPNLVAFASLDARALAGAVKGVPDLTTLAGLGEGWTAALARGLVEDPLAWAGHKFVRALASARGRVPDLESRTIDLATAGARAGFLVPCLAVGTGCWRSGA